MVLRVKGQLKPKKCKQCPCVFTPTSPLQCVCSRQCANERAKAKEKEKLKKTPFKTKLVLDGKELDAHIIDGDERFVEQTDERHAARAASQMASALETKELITRVGLAALVSQDEPSCAPILKDNAVHHEGYRRLVASLPCMWCGRHGRSNHAHENENKGKGLKLDDRRSMSLCVDDLGTGGCHTAFDQYALIDGGREAHVELGRILAKRTRKLVFDSGLWPKNLPLWIEKNDQDAKTSCVRGGPGAAGDGAGVERISAEPVAGLLCDSRHEDAARVAISESRTATGGDPSNPHAP